MATTEEISLIRVKTEGAESIGQLKENIKALKEALDTTTIGTEEYQEALNLLKLNQNAVKDAMYATSASLKDVMESASGTSQTYNGLVHRMAAMKEELRNTDISTKEGKERFDELAIAINGVNDQLKEMDKAQGNFQRNVGNYESAFKGMAKYTDAFDKGLKVTSGSLGAVKGGFEAMSATPAVATFAILVSAVGKLAEGLKDNDTAMEAVQKGLNSLKPIMDFVSGIVEKLAEILADVIGKVSEFVTNNGLIDKVIKGVTGIGNAIVKFVVSPFKGVIEAIKIFKEKGVKGLGDAAKAFGAEMKSGVAFKANFQSGQTLADTLVKGAKSKKKDVEQAGKEVGETFADAVNKAFEEGQKKNASRESYLDAQQKELDALIQSDMDAMSAEIDAFFAEEEELLERQRIMDEYYQEEADRRQAEEEKRAKAKIDTMKAVASATSDILSSIADMYETDEENAAKNANKIKALRIASATIDTISGAIGAFMQASETIPPPYGQIVGGIQAAVVTAAGMANIAKIKSTKISGGGSSSASVSAPSIPTEVSSVRNVTSASEEDRFNEMASSQRVYILSSDIEASQSARRVQTAESSF